MSAEHWIKLRAPLRPPMRRSCEACIQAHEKAVLDGGLTEDHVHDAVRIAAVVNAAAVAFEAASVPQALPASV